MTMHLTHTSKSLKFINVINAGISDNILVCINYTVNVHEAKNQSFSKL